MTHSSGATSAKSTPVMRGQARKVLAFGGLGSSSPVGWGSQRMSVEKGALSVL